MIHKNLCRSTCRSQTNNEAKQCKISAALRWLKLERTTWPHQEQIKISFSSFAFQSNCYLFLCYELFCAQSCHQKTHTSLPPTNFKF